MTNPFPIAPANIPFITTEQMREVDRAMIEDFDITLLQMMENAGRNLADVVVGRVLSGNTKGKKILVVAGPGGNGGGGLVAARHLHNRGCDVSILVTTKDESKFILTVRHQFRILQQMGIRLESKSSTPFDNYDAIVDAIYGYSLSGSPREPAASIIRRINESPTPVVSNDIPTGIDATTGEIHEPAIRAVATVTIALPKTAFENQESNKLAGELYLGDISVPIDLYERSLKLNVPNIFGEGSVVEISPRTI